MSVCLFVCLYVFSARRLCCFFKTPKKNQRAPGLCCCLSSPLLGLQQCQMEEERERLHAGGATAITCWRSDSDYTSLYVTWRSGSDYMSFSAISPAPTVLVTFSACSRPRPLARFAATTSHRLACLRLQLALLLLRYQRASFFISCCTFLYLIFCVQFKIETFFKG